MQSSLKQIIGNCLIASLTGNNIQESSFLEYYSNLLQIAKSVSFSIPIYLMNLDNISEIILILSKSEI